VCGATKRQGPTAIHFLSVRAALRAVGAAAADESPRLLRNTYGRRQLLEGKTNEQVSNRLGLSSHRTATRLRETLTETGEPDDADVVRKAARNFMSISVINKTSEGFGQRFRSADGCSGSLLYTPLYIYLSA
jgi:hypothetical protein